MDLTGKLLIAMPGMGDPRFEHAVAAVCAHSPEGAMGVIVNKPLPTPGLKDLLTQLGIAGDRLGPARACADPVRRPGRDRARLRAAFARLDVGRGRRWR